MGLMLEMRSREENFRQMEQYVQRPRGEIKLTVMEKRKEKKDKPAGGPRGREGM